MSDFVPFTYVRVVLTKLNIYTHYTFSTTETDQYKWCLENFGYSHRWWVVAESHKREYALANLLDPIITAQFCFDNESDALMFRLRWS